MPRSRVRVPFRVPASAALPCFLLVAGCSGGGDPPGEQEGEEIAIQKGQYSRAWFDEQTIDDRGTLSLPEPFDWLLNEDLESQLAEYDPGSTVRCAVEEDANYADLLDQLGGSRWNYFVGLIEDTSTPRFEMGVNNYPPSWGDDISISDGAEVEIAESDIVGVSETSALFLSSVHGLLMVDLKGTEPVFDCAARLPGVVDQFYLHEGRLVIIVKDAALETSQLLHFSVKNDELAFVESVDLGRSHVLDSRRFNDRLVLYTDLDTGAETTAVTRPSGGEGSAWDPSGASNRNRILRVFKWGDALSEELTETHIDNTTSQDYLARGGFDRATPVGTVVNTSSSMGTQMWASDRYFVVAESKTETTLARWETRHYEECVEHHEEPYSYESCHTKYETRPNPNYTEPENTGGDRACSGATLSSCIQKVARESSKTIRVPIGTSCEVVESSHFVCDRHESHSSTSPEFTYETHTSLHIYEYTDEGFIRFSDEVIDVDLENLTTTALDDSIDNLALAEEAAELRIEGHVQAVQFQNGYLYVVGEGMLQTYALAENSLLRTSTRQLTNGGGIEAFQFTPEKLYLSSSSWAQGGELSVLRVIDLSNGAFPIQSSVDRLLPGSHQLILPTASGILTTGFVNRFDGNDVNLIKVGLFEDPSTIELSYLFLGTDLSVLQNGASETSFFDPVSERLFWPYTGFELENAAYRTRVGISRIEETELVSEGAVDLAVAPERIRQRPGTSEMLAFAASSIQALRPAGSGWETTSVLEYFTPTGVYRLNEDDEYVELLRLGNRCKLHFSSASALNERTEENVSEPFFCGNWEGIGYKQNLLFGDKLAFHFEYDGTFEQLPVTEAVALWAKAMSRDVCLFSDELFESNENLAIDPFEPPNLDEMFCMSAKDHALFVEQVIVDSAQESDR